MVSVKIRARLFLLRAMRENLFQASLLAFGSLTHYLAYRCRLSLWLHINFPLYMFVPDFLFLQGYQLYWIKAQPIDLILTWSFAQTLFPGKVTLFGQGWGCTIQLITEGIEQSCQTASKCLLPFLFTGLSILLSPAWVNCSSAVPSTVARVGSKVREPHYIG